MPVAIHSTLPQIIALAVLVLGALQGCTSPPPTSFCEPGEQCVVISEFMAAGNTTLMDPAGEFSDWIEVHNPTDRSINLVGWTLSDDESRPAKWAFPDTPLGAGEFVVVFASGTPASGVQTNFRLSRAGEYLALSDPSGRTVFEFAPSYPEQASGFSYGLPFAEGALSDGAPVFFLIPTPGEPNSAGAQSPVSAPELSRAGGTFVGELELALSSAHPESTVRYTLDGSDPTLDDPEFSEPIEITRTTTVRARAFATGSLPSSVVEAMFLELDDDLESFSSNLPLVLIDTSEQDVIREEFIDAQAAIIDADMDGRVRPLSEAARHGRIGLRHRGSSSNNYPKRSFALELRDAEGKDHADEMLGMPADSDWVLYAPYSDKSLLRSHMAFHWSRAVGRYAPRTRLVEVFVNDSDDDGLSMEHYVGVYELIEKVTAGPERVDVRVVGSGDLQDPEISGGYIFASDRRGPGESGFETPTGARFTFVEPKEADIAPSQASWLAEWLGGVEIAFSRGDALGENGTPPLIDLNSFVDHHLLTEFIRNPDGLRLSTFMVKPRDAPLRMGPLWDGDRCFGNASDHSFEVPDAWGYAAFTDTEPAYDEACDCPSNCGATSCTPTWWRRLYGNSTFVTTYARRWAEWRAGPLSNAQIDADIEMARLELAEAQVRNFERWEILGRRINPNFFVGDTWEEEVEYLRQYVHDRVAWMDNELQ